MSLVLRKDRSGVPLAMCEWDGYYLPPELNGHLTEGSLYDYLNGGDYSGSEVLLCSYPRSGFHWFYENVHMLLTKTKSVTNTIVSKTVIELKALRNNENPRIINTHLCPELVPDALKNRKRIFMYRNPKDVAYSMYRIETQVHKYGGIFEDYAEMFLDGNVFYGSWFDHTLKWEETLSREENICVVSYEDMAKNPILVLRRLADYLEVDASDEFLLDVSQACHIEKMRVKNPIPDIELVRKGVVGGWKSHFTVSLSEKFDRIFEEKMKTSKLEFCF